MVETIARISNFKFYESFTGSLEALHCGLPTQKALRLCVPIYTTDQNEYDQSATSFKARPLLIRGIDTGPTS